MSAQTVFSKGRLLTQPLRRFLPNHPDSMTKNGMFWAVALVVLLVQTGIADLTYGTNDVLFFKSYATAIENNGVADLYSNGAPLVEYYVERNEFFAHPPAVLHFIRATSWLSRSSGLRFEFVFRTLTSFAHIGCALLLLALAGRKAAVLLLVSPAGILVTGFHGNTDAVVVLLLLTAVWAQRRPGGTAYCGIPLALSISIKIWPVILGPLFFLYADTTRERIKFALYFLAAATLAGLPYILEAPATIWQSVTSYRSYPGRWGLTLFAIGSAPYLLPICIVAILFVAVCAYRNGWPLLRAVALTTMIFLILTPGFGVQYLYWLLPFFFLFGKPTAVFLHVLCGAFVMLTYTLWSRKIPWYFADALRPGLVFTGAEALLSLLIWMGLVVATLTNLWGWANRGGETNEQGI